MTAENELEGAAQMSNLNELGSDGAMVMNLESFGVDGAGYDETARRPPRLPSDSDRAAAAAARRH